MLHASDNPSNPFFIEGIWFVPDSQGIDRTSRFYLARDMYILHSRESIMLITSRSIKDYSKNTTVESGIYLGKKSGK